MSKYKFNIIQRQALWEAHNRRCQYCGELIFEFNSLSIDHIVPEHLLKTPKDLQTLISECKLGEDFKVNSYQNWIPCHLACNLKKGGEIFSKNSIIFYFELAKSKIGKVEEIEKKLKLDLKKSKILTNLARAISLGEVTENEIREILDSDYNGLTKIHLSSEVEFGDMVYSKWIYEENLDKLYDLKIANFNDIAFVEFINDDGDAIRIETCNEWKDALSDGYFPKTNKDILSSGMFVKNCGLLDTIKKAKVPTTSYISAPRVGLNSLKLLSVDILGKRESRGITGRFYELIKSGRVEIEHVTGVSLRFIDHEECQNVFLLEQFRADLNDDGIEDMLVYAYIRDSTGGSFGMSYNFILSKKSKEGLLTVVWS